MHLFPIPKSYKDDRQECIHRWQNTFTNTKDTLLKYLNLVRSIELRSNFQPGTAKIFEAGS